MQNKQLFKMGNLVRWLAMYILLLFSSGFYFRDNMGTRALIMMFIGSLLLMASYGLKLSQCTKKNLFIFAIVLIFVIISSVIAQDEIKRTIIFLIGYISALIIVLSVRTVNYMSIYIKVLRSLILSSLVINFLEIIQIHAYNFLPSITLNDSHFMFLTNIRNYGSQIRNSSIFWEPGAFQTFLVISYIFELKIKNKNHVLFRWLIIITLFTTLSTTGIICAFILLCTRLIFVNDITKNRRTRIKGMLSMVWHTAINHSGKNIDDLCKLIDDDTVLVSHSPSIDSILICRAIKQKFPKIRYVQYWSDPITLALISPKDYSVKRLPFFWVENRLHKSADTIVYGTKSLYIGQKSLFKKYSEKMAYCDVSYCIDNEISDSSPSAIKKELLFGYFGGYNSSVRDIRQLYSAFDGGDGKLLICGNGDIALAERSNIEVLNRVPQSEVASLEASADVYICILNKHGIQIPGKVFYLTDSDKYILVICDGDYKKMIREYLSSFKRFIFCENTIDDIRRVIKEINMGQHSIDKSELYRLSPKYVSKSIIDGGFKE